jgi:hypothetical protein
MAIIDLYLKRKKRRASQGKVDVYQYDTIPDRLRVQIAQVVRDALGCWYLRDRGYYDGRQTSPSLEIRVTLKAREVSGCCNC